MLQLCWALVALKACQSHAESLWSGSHQRSTPWCWQFCVEPKGGGQVNGTQAQGQCRGHAGHRWHTDKRVSILCRHFLCSFLSYVQVTQGAWKEHRPKVEVAENNRAHSWASRWLPYRDLLGEIFPHKRGLREKTGKEGWKERERE